MKKKSSLKEFQQQFTQHIRNPKKQARPSQISAGRMNIYNTLLFNNFYEVLSSCFPISKEILKTQKWNTLVRHFFETHSCQRPFFREIPDEFVAYLHSKKTILQNRVPDFLRHLAHYEWMELVLFLQKTPPLKKIKKNGNLLSQIPVLNPDSHLLHYPYPVHLFSSSKTKFQTPSQIPFFYFIFRDSAGEVESLTLNPVSARLIQLMQQSKYTGEGLLQKIARELKHPEPEIVKKNGIEILKELRDKGAILGTQP